MAGEVGGSDGDAAADGSKLGGGTTYGPSAKEAWSKPSDASHDEKRGLCIGAGTGADAGGEAGAAADGSNAGGSDLTPLSSGAGDEAHSEAREVALRGCPEKCLCTGAGAGADAGSEGTDVGTGVAWARAEPPPTPSPEEKSSCCGGGEGECRGAEGSDSGMEASLGGLGVRRGGTAT